jgi:hypothetical protein
MHAECFSNNAQREAGAVHRGYHFITEQPPALSAATGIGREAIDRADYLKLDIHLCVHAYGRLSDRLHLSSSLRLTKKPRHVLHNV